MAELLRREAGPSLEQVIRALPAPLGEDAFALYRKGVDGGADISVYMNDRKDFALLFPQPAFDYAQYEPRFKQLKLEGYRKRNQVVESRFKKIESYCEGAVSLLEIGSFDGGFLEHARQHDGRLRLASLEVDAQSRPDRDRLPWLDQYSDFSQLKDHRFDRVCFFHVLEHVAEPAGFLDCCRAVLAPGGRLIIEVPSLDDPLLKLYAVPEYEEFYFQRQHPYVYSASSLGRVLEAHGFRVERCLPHQRYGLENHLTWLRRRRPGGDEALRTLFAPVDAAYRAQIEAAGFADAVIVVAVDQRAESARSGR